jgi:hypothetical protein
MRTTTRLCLVAAIAAAVALSAVPIAQAAKRPGAVNIKGISADHNDAAQNKKIRKAQRRVNKAHRRIRRLKSWNFTLQDWNKNQQSAIESLESTVSTIVAGVPAITSALTQLQDGLLELKAALEGDVTDAFEDIEDALNDPVTGLVGLNLARPQFAVVAGGAGNGTFLGGTGAAGGLGPVDQSDVVVGTTAGTNTGQYVVDFNNDVSLRQYTVNVAPATGLTTPTASAVNCDSGAPFNGQCDAVSAGSGDDPNKVLVQIGDGDPAPATFFSVTALSG